MPVLFHLLDSVAQDRDIEREDETTREVRYVSNSDNDASDDEEAIHNKKPKRSTNNYNKPREYVVHLFGNTAEGKPVRITAANFRPFFYVGLPPIPEAYRKFKDHFALTLKAKRIDPAAVSTRLVKKKLMYGYTGGKEFHIVELSFPSRKALYDVRRLFVDECNQPCYELVRDCDPLQVYDANLDPMLRFFHLRKIQPCGWIQLDCDLSDLEEDGGMLCGECDWEEIRPAVGPVAVAPFLTNFWDIECYNEHGDFPKAENGDPIIQIGNVLVRQGSAPEKHIFVYGTCDPVPGAVVHACKTEKAMLREWAAFLELENPDILVGYNIFGFDEKYVWDRCKKLGIDQCTEFQAFNRLANLGQECKLEEKFLSSSALGDNNLYMWSAAGRLQVDLYHYVRRGTQLPSYKLDAVCTHFMSGKLGSMEFGEKEWVLKTKQTGDVSEGRYVVVLDEIGEALVDKMKVLRVEPGKAIVVEAPVGQDTEILQSDAVKWAVVKDDVPPAEIFRLHREDGAAGRARVAAYCIQDCDLVFELYKKLDVFNNAMSMANVCTVPVSYIMTRGQGVKIESLIFKYCYERGIVVQCLKTPPRGAAAAESTEAAESYEGAIVLTPDPGFYSESPIGVCDFASLYPSTIISEDISHDSLAWVKDYDLQGNLVSIPYGSVADEAHAPEGTRWTDIAFDIWKPDPADTRKHPEKIKVGVRVCRYAQKPDGSKHTLPDIVATLLAARKAKRKEAEKEQDPFRKALLDAEQLAYKLTANSLYGQLGSSTFKVRLVHLAASVTGYGRKQILFAKAGIEKFYGPAAGDPRCSAKVIYGDTDSLFVDFGVKDPATGKPLQGVAAIEATMHITEEAGKFITGALKAPHDFEYDKVFDQFIIFSKKRYVGNKYEESAIDFKQTSMGIALKRRDNAPILKTIYGGAIQILLNERDVRKAAEFVQAKAMELVEGKVSLSQLTITKSLSMYKADWIKKDMAALERNLKTCKPTEVARLTALLEKKKVDLAAAPAYPPQKMLANRMNERDPGSAPAPGERIGYIYISPPPGQEAPKLQGDHIETPDYIRSKGLKPDARYYIEHQLINPLGELFGLMVEKMPGYQAKVGVLTEGQRITIAVDLLFRQALGACKKSAVRNFFQQQFGAPTAAAATAATLAVTDTPRRSTRATSGAAAKGAVVKQSTIERYMLTKVMVEEQKAAAAAAAAAVSATAAAGAKRTKKK